MVMEALPNADSFDMTPYTEKPDYMSSPIFKESYMARQRVADAQKELDEQSVTPSPPPPSPPGSSEPGSSPQSSPKTTRPPLFTRHSTTSGVISTSSNTVNPENSITKTFLARSKKFLNPETAAAAPRSRPQTPNSSSSTTHYVEFRVIDTGPGVPEDMQSKIFEPFVQGDVGLSRKYGGTGLGLSICQQLAKLMGGDIHIKSFEGAGSTFTLRIPLRFAPNSMMLASPSMPSRPLSTGEKSARATTNSLSAFSGPAFSGRSVQESIPSGQEGKMRLVGLSQPFFISSRQDNEDELHGSPPPPDDALQPGRNIPSNITPITEVTTPGTDRTLQKGEFPPSHEAGHPERSDKSELEEKTIRVLVAEDNKINQTLMAKLLQLEGVDEVTVAKDGQEAVDRVRERIGGLEETGYDIVFMDIQVSTIPFSL
jgi:osomolarity two-component system sensor histidine kinase SLN1